MKKDKKIGIFEIIGIIVVIGGLLFAMATIIIDSGNYGYIDGKHIKCTKWTKDATLAMASVCINWEEITTIPNHWRGA